MSYRRSNRTHLRAVRKLQEAQRRTTDARIAELAQSATRPGR